MLVFPLAVLSLVAVLALIVWWSARKFDRDYTDKHDQ